MKRQFTKKAAMILLAVFCVLAGGVTAFAEANDSKETARTLPVNQKTNDTMGESKYKWYETKLTEDGYFTVDFHYTETMSALKYWKLSVMVEDRFILTDKVINESGGSYSSPKYPFPKGTKVYVRLENVGAGNAEYTLSVNHVVSKEWESESNDTQETADTLPVGKMLYGNFFTGDKADYYTATLSKTGYFTLNLNNGSPDVQTIGGLEVSIFVGGKQVASSGFIAGDAKINGYTSPRLGYKKGQKIVIMVKNEELNASYAKNGDYKITLKNTSSLVWETESNDSKNRFDRKDKCEKRIEDLCGCHQCTEIV